MNSQTLNSRARLEHVEVLLREVLARDFEGDTKGNGGSLGRILVHVVNIHHAVSTSPDGHSNAAKRLGDFAVTMDRMALGKPDSDQRLTRVAEALRVARAGMNELATLPQS